MTGTKHKARKSMLIETLKENHFNISDACRQLDISLAEFYELKKDEEFCKKLEEVDQSVKDFVRSKLMSLVSRDDRNAIIEFNKWLRQEDDNNTKLVSRKKTMKLLIETMDNKSICLRKFSEIFDESAKMAEKYYQIAITEYQLLSPAQRKKQEMAEESQKLSKMFEDGKLNEVSMIQGLLKQALHDAECSEYPSERAKATEQSIKLTQRLEEIQERQRREEEEDDTPLFLKVDAIMMSSSPDHIKQVNEQLKAIESNG